MGSMFTNSVFLSTLFPEDSPHQNHAEMNPSPSLSLAQRVGSRIERARAMRGHSLRSLADALGNQLSHTTLQKYEKGALTPESRTLGMIARALDVRLEYFLKEDSLKLEAFEYRKLSKLGKKEQKRIEEEAFEFFERYLEIESILEIEQEQLPRFDLANKSDVELPEAIEEATLQLREKWKLGLNPIPNIHTMLENHGVKVKLVSNREGFDGISAFAQAGGKRVPTIALGAKKDVDATRLRFTALHELAHLVLGLPTRLAQKEVESACHRFASALLIPKEIFVKIFGENRVKISVAELKAIKEEWGISCMAIMARARDLALITAGRFKSFCILANKWGWRKREPGSWAGDESSSRFMQLVLRALATDTITASKACGLLQWTSEQLAAEYQLIEE